VRKRREQTSNEVIVGSFLKEVRWMKKRQKSSRRPEILERIASIQWSEPLPEKTMSEGSTKFKRSVCDRDTPSREKIKRIDRANKDEKGEKCHFGIR
jgi:hypothetical protein